MYAQNEFEKAVELLEKASGEDVSFLGELTFLAGKQTGGLEKIQRQVDRRRNEVIPLARLAYFQFQSGDLESAKTSFEKLRDCSTCIDLDIPMFSRMEKMAVELGFGKNWLKSPSIAADTGFRPQLESLGPMRWSPTKAPEWLLQGFDGTHFGSDDLAGQPTIVIFYLGHGCLHCAEQLQAFGPEYESFKRNGIEMIAISSDDESGLKLSLDNYDGQMPIRLISDASQTVFKQFRAYDDFEGLPLHGTFLIDADGFIRWQDISYEPFMDHEFLLTESVRLLSKQVDESNAKITTK